MVTTVLPYHILVKLKAVFDICINLPCEYLVIKASTFLVYEQTGPAGTPNAAGLSFPQFSFNSAVPVWADAVGRGRLN